MRGSMLFLLGILCLLLFDNDSPSLSHRILEIQISWNHPQVWPILFAWSHVRVSVNIRDLYTQQQGWKTQDEKLSHKTGNAQSRATFFCHSSVLSVPAILLLKVPNETPVLFIKSKDYCKVTVKAFKLILLHVHVCINYL